MEGYSAGHFPKAWQELCEHFEETATLDLVDLQQEYFDMKMEEDKEPSLFIVKLERMRKKLRDNGHSISDKDFLKQVLAKLPKGKEEELGPYQVEKRSIVLHMEIDNNYNLGRMKNDLEKVYKDVYAERKEKDEEPDVAMAAYGRQYKGRCRKCGKYGHKSYNCRSGNSNDSTSNIKCFFCGKRGHKITVCRKFERYKENQGDDSGDDDDEDGANYAREEIVF